MVIKASNTQRVHPNIRRLFKDSFRIRMPKGMIRSIEEQQSLPDLMSGDRKIDEMQQREMVTLYITPVAMIGYYKEGIPFYIHNEKDAARIYEAIIDHTSAWRKSLRFDLSGDECPAQDLLDMEKFASEIYDIAKYHFSSDSYHDPVRATQQRLGGMAALMEQQNAFLQIKPVVPKAQDIKERKYNPDIDLFASALVRSSQNDRL